MSTSLPPAKPIASIRQRLLDRARVRGEDFGDAVTPAPMEADYPVLLALLRKGATDLPGVATATELVVVTAVRYATVQGGPP